jgi:hypothetical protein
MKNRFITWFKNLFARPVKIGWKAEADGTIGVYAQYVKSKKLIGGYRITEIGLLKPRQENGNRTHKENSTRTR